MQKFDFNEAMQWIDFGEVVGVKLEGKTRVYYKDNDVMMCKVKNIIYPVKTFYLDAIESKDWTLFEGCLGMIEQLEFDIDEAV